MRGKASVHVQPQAEPGIIPVGAGKSSGRPPQTPSPRDHPRGCGEKLWHLAPDPQASGSSPRVRGEVHVGRRRGLGMGIIPRVRGKGRGGGAEEDNRGIIPAGAGRSRGAGSRGRRDGDHPRGCGEKRHGGHPGASAEGSSPRVRGEAANLLTAPRRTGIIPAGAGRRIGATLGARNRRDHPRGCGEKMEGKGKRVVSLGIIPAGAGRSATGGENGGVCGDHPRGCGEKRKPSLVSTQVRGSSPRVRGGAGEGRDRCRAHPRRTPYVGVG